MRSRFASPLPVLLILAVACVGALRHDQGAARRDRNWDEHAVLAAVLAWVAADGPALVDAWTEPVSAPPPGETQDASGYWVQAGRQLGALPPGVAADMIAASEGARLLAAWVQLPAPLVYDCRSVPVAGEPTAGRASCGALPTLSLSRPGFGARRQTALVEFARHCGPRCGVGGLVRLVRHGAVWQVERTAVLLEF